VVVDEHFPFKEIDVGIEYEQWCGGVGESVLRKQTKIFLPLHGLSAFGWYTVSTVHTMIDIIITISHGWRIFYIG